MNNKVTLKILVSLLVLVVLFGVAQTVSADVKGNENFYAWDRTDEKFVASNADIFFDGGKVQLHSCD